ncbi:MAG TPA: helix-hairpin-helix domain-containing protein [Saprospiraceae bacterium]|nr:helix-hairpin-helix domain-containing protein [Saprospiraceae bacterium]
MNKEYHYTISRTDRICLITFVIVLLGWELIKEILPRGENSFTYISPPSEHHGYKAGKKFNYSNHDYPKKYFSSYSNTYEKKYSSYEEEQEPSPPSSPLSIMTATFGELTSMGLSKKVAYNIQKFINSGGIITNDHDLMKIYGMDSLQLDNASPYIIYGTLPAAPASITLLNEKPAPGTPLKTIDINQASIADLESLDGIGEVLATRIIKYRESIGGFLYPDQLAECYGIPPETIVKIKDQITVSGSPHFILINEMNLDSLKHPYLNKKLIRLIKAYKNQHGNFKNASDFRKIYPPDSNWCNKVLPYISFDVNE